MERPYHIMEKDDTRGLASFLAKNGQALLPMVELIEQSQMAVDEVIEVLGRATIEAVLRLSAEGIAGPPHPGRKTGTVGWHGREQGTVCLKERKLRVVRPRLRKKGEQEGGEVPIPAYEAMRQDGRLGSRMLEILLRGVSTRQYGKVLPQMAETAGVSRSSVSREAAEAREEELKRLCERRFEEVELLAIYLDGVRFGEHQVLVAVGVDEKGNKHVLGIAEGASENQEVAKGLLEDVVGRGVKSDRKYLFVIDGSKALRAAIEAVFGASNPVQRCRNHIAGRDPRLPEGWKVPSRASPYEPGSLGSGVTGEPVASKQTRHVASVPSPEARANVQAVPQGKALWRRHGISDGYHWESPGTGWSSRLCNDEDSNDGGCVGKRSGRHPRCFEQRHERKEA